MADDIGKWFDRYREYVRHEDSLINNRVTWLVTMQSILIATCGFSCQKIYEVQAKLPDQLNLQKIDELTWVLIGVIFAMGMIGLGFAYISFNSISAANDAIKSLRKKWEASFSTEADFDSFPKLTGGNDDRVIPRGFQSAERLAIFFLFLWIFVLAGIALLFAVNLPNLSDVMSFSSSR